jgi:plastocyanin
LAHYAPKIGEPAVKPQIAGRAKKSSPLTLSMLALALGLLALAGCGSSSNSTSSATSAPATTATTATTAATPATTGSTSTTSAPAAGAETIAVAADPEGQLKFTTSTLSAKAGKVTIAFTNRAPLEHNLTVASASGAVVGTTPTFQGGTKNVTASLTPGTYKFYCTVPGHRQAGMEGTLVVK